MSRSTIQVLSNAIRASSRSQASCSDHQTVISSPFTGWLQLTQMLEAVRRSATVP
jgi:hypothetical protein